MVHAVRIRCANEQIPSPQTLRDRVETVITNHGRRLAAQEHPMSVVSGPETAEHVRGLYRANNSRSGLVTALGNALDDVGWYEIGYHECRHDEQPVRPCEGWTVVASSGAMPSGAA